jgi:hypothetical protein
MTEWKKLVGKRVLVKIGWANLDEWRVDEVLPSGNHVCLGHHWHDINKVTLIEVLD